MTSLTDRECQLIARLCRMEDVTENSLAVILQKLGLRNARELRLWASPISDADLAQLRVPRSVKPIEAGIFLPRTNERTFEELVHDFKGAIVGKAIRDSGGNKTMAAALLSISRTYLHRIVKEANT